MTKEELKELTEEESNLEELWDYIASNIGFEEREIKIQNAIRKFVTLKFDLYKQELDEETEKKLAEKVIEMNGYYLQDQDKWRERHYDDFKIKLVEKVKEKKNWYSGGGNAPIRDALDEVISIINEPL